MLIPMKNLYRSSDEKVVAGVCAGLADRFDLNVTGLRWLFALTAFFFTGIPIIVYLILAILLKPRPTADDGVIDV